MSKDTREEETPRKTRPMTLFRYSSREHHELIRKCAEYAGVSMNDWICLVTMKVARREAAQFEHEAEA